MLCVFNGHDQYYWSLIYKSLLKLTPLNVTDQLNIRASQSTFLVLVFPICAKCLRVGCRNSVSQNHVIPQRQFKMGSLANNNNNKKRSSKRNYILRDMSRNSYMPQGNHESSWEKYVTSYYLTSLKDTETSED